MLYDISVPVTESITTWPGDPGVKIQQTMSLCCGDPATVSEIKLGVHTGTHVDAFSHFLNNGKTLSEMDLAPYVGPALVVDIADPTAVTRQELETHKLADHFKQAKRVLFKTANSAAPWYQEPFNENFVHLHPDAARYLVDRGVQLVGIDYLSVESYKAAELYPNDNSGHAPTHHILMRGGVYIVEGLYLAGVEPGEYRMTCLPMALSGADGAPARVILEKN